VIGNEQLTATTGLSSYQGGTCDEFSRVACLFAVLPSEVKMTYGSYLYEQQCNSILSGIYFISDMCLQSDMSGYFVRSWIKFKR